MNLRYPASLLMMAVVLSGCVSSKTYEARVAEISDLRQTMAGLEARLRDAERGLTALTKKQELLLAEKKSLEDRNENLKSTLEARRDGLTRQVVSLKDEIAGLKSKAEALEREKALAVEEKERAIARMKGTYENLVQELKGEIREGEIQITQLKDKLTVNLVEKILFDSGSARIKASGRKVLDRVAAILKQVKGQDIKIEGHTDDVPIGPVLADTFPTNWELSTARATTVVRYLQEQDVAPEVLSAEGYAEYRPVAPNETAEGRAKNRRIEIVLVPQDRAASAPGN